MKLNFFTILIVLVTIQFGQAQDKSFEKGELTSKHEQLSSTGIFLVPPYEYDKAISFIGYYNKNGEMIYTPLSEEKYIVEIEKQTNSASNSFKINEAKIIYYEDKTNFQSILFGEYKKKFFKIQIKSNNQEEFEKLQQSLNTILFK